MALAPPSGFISRKARNTPGRVVVRWGGGGVGPTAVNPGQAWVVVRLGGKDFRSLRRLRKSEGKRYHHPAARGMDPRPDGHRLAALGTPTPQLRISFPSHVWPPRFGKASDLHACRLGWRRHFSVWAST